MGKKVISISYQWCKHCALCIKSCPRKVYEIDETGAPYVAAPDRCSGCNLCVLRCPELAIELGES